MPKKLKVCLAMGGGVSLGSFSGAALTEALKLLVLFGKDKSGEDYEDIIIDGMSGASAGAIALTIMMKCLMDYKAILPVYNKNKQESEGLVTKESLIRELETSYSAGIVQSISEKKKEQLKAMQLAQKVQHQLWTKLVTTKELFKPAKHANPHKSFGLLNRSVLTRLANEYIVEIGSLNLDNRQLLDPKRVIFACSLTNVLPMELHEKSTAEGNNLMENYLKSTGSENHTELRVIDFVFDPNCKNSDRRWFELRKNAGEYQLEGPVKNPKMILDIEQPKGWAILAASALACGAFPVAFDPVLLKRYKDEYSEKNWPRIFKKIQNQIPDNEIEKSFFNESGDNYLDYNVFNFPYIDGGTFNNEPIREAFRIGSFQDQDGNLENIDRLVLFVDPIVRTGKYNSFNVGSFNAVSRDGDLKTKFKSESSKLFSNVTDIIGVLANQGSIKEEHRINDAKENIQLRKALFEFIQGDGNESVDYFKTMTGQLIKTSFEKIGANLERDMIPVGERDVKAFFNRAFKEHCKESKSICTLPEDAIFEAIIREVMEETPNVERIFQLFNTGVSDEKEQRLRKNLFSQTILRIMIDFSLKTVGKNPDAELMAVLPIEIEKFETIELPGSEVEAFAGFASDESREYAFEYGRLSTLVSLRERKKGFRKESDTPIISDVALNDIYKQMNDTIGEEPFYNPKYRYSEDIRLQLYHKIIKRLFDLFLPKEKWQQYLVVGLPTLLAAPFIALGGIIKGGLKYAKSIKKIAFHSGDRAAAEINNKKLLPITISILSKRDLGKKVKVSFLDNKKDDTEITMERHEHGENGFQYLLNLFYLDYVDLEKLKDSKTAKIESIGRHKYSDSDKVHRVGLAVSNKIQNPSMDGNINVVEYRKEIQKRSEEIEIKGISIKGHNLGNIIDDINNQEFSMFYSLKNLEYHVNPMLEYNLDNENDTWYFKENTKAYYLSLLES